MLLVVEAPWGGHAGPRQRQSSCIQAHADILRRRWALCMLVIDTVLLGHWRKSSAAPV
jgi:hypothetical protein